MCVRVRVRAHVCACVYLYVFRLRECECACGRGCLCVSPNAQLPIQSYLSSKHIYHSCIVFTFVRILNVM